MTIEPLALVELGAQYGIAGLLAWVLYDAQRGIRADLREGVAGFRADLRTQSDALLRILASALATERRRHGDADEDDTTETIFRHAKTQEDQ